MSEKPILFSGLMVQAILEGRKTQTRRLVSGQPQGRLLGLLQRSVRGENRLRAWFGCTPIGGNSSIEVTCPYGKTGDHLWVREAWGCPSADHPRCKDGRKPSTGDRIVYAADGADAYQWRTGEPGCGDFVWRTPIFMPRWASRITLKITEVRVERLQDISEEDARAEGASQWEFNPEQPLTSGERSGDSPYRSGFAYLWDHINEDRATWKSNPFVWVIGFRRVGTSE